MAAGDWAAGTKVIMLDVSVSFDGTVDNNPTIVNAGYRIVLPSGAVLPDLRTVNLNPPDANALAALAPALTALHSLVAGAEGLS